MAPTPAGAPAASGLEQRQIRPLSQTRKRDVSRAAESLSIDDLIRLANLCSKSIANVTEERDLYMTRLEELLEEMADAQKFEYVSKEGKAEREVKRRYRAKADKMEEAKAEFGPMYGEYFDEKEKIKQDSKALPILRERLGADFDKFFVVTVDVKPTRLCSSVAGQQKDGMADAKHPNLLPFVEITEDVTISVTAPV